MIEMFFDFRCIIYSTHKHTAEKPRLRLIIPILREVTPDEYIAVSRKIAEEIGIEYFDDTTYEPSRLMYWASTSADGEFIFKDIEGNLLNPDLVLAKYKDWRNTAELPVSNRQQTIVQRDIKKQADPLEKKVLWVHSVVPIRLLRLLTNLYQMYINHLLWTEDMIMFLLIQAQVL